MDSVDYINNSFCLTLPWVSNQPTWSALATIKVINLKLTYCK